MATRYSGTVKISIRYVDSITHSPNGHYRVSMTSPCSMFRCGYSAIIGAPRYLSHAVDAPEAYDAVARAALSFCAADAEKTRTPGAKWADRERYASDLIACASFGWDPTVFGGQGWEVFTRAIHAIDARDGKRGAAHV